MSFLGKLGGLVNNPGGFFGTNGGIGEAVNDITGATNSAKTQYKNQLNLQKDAQNFAKWQMANAHQMEVQDLEKAGLNAVLSAGGGASAGVTEGGANVGHPSLDPISAISNFVGMLNNSKQTNAEVAKANAEIKNNTNLTDANVIEALANAKKAGADKQQIDAILEFYNETGTFPGAMDTVGYHGPLGIGATTTESIKNPKKIKRENSAKATSKERSKEKSMYKKFYNSKREF